MRQGVIFAHCSEKNSFGKSNPKFNIHMKILLPYLISELLLSLITAAYSLFIITLIYFAEVKLSLSSSLNIKSS